MTSKTMQLASMCTALVTAFPAVSFAMLPADSVGVMSFSAPAAVKYDEFRKLKAWTTLWEDVGGLTKLGVDWEDAEGLPPADNLIRDLRSIVLALQAVGAPVPRLYATAEGEIGLKWSGNRFASVSLMPDGNLVAYVPGAAGEPPLELDEPMTDIALQSITAYVSAMA